MLRRRDQQAVLNFVQGIDEPFYIAWERYKELLRTVSKHGFVREGQIPNFLNGLTTATITWVEGENDITSFYDQYVDEAYWLLNDLAGYEYHCWSTLRDHYGSKGILYNPSQWKELPSP